MESIIEMINMNWRWMGPVIVIGLMAGLSLAVRAIWKN